MQKKVQSHFFEISLVLVSVAVLAVLYFRLPYGLDFTDESYYVAQAVEFSKGYRPYLDEILSMQSAFILLVPFADLFYKMVPSGEGVFLAFRLVYFFCFLGFAFFSFLFLRSSQTITISLLGGLFSLTFWPFNIPTLSYNTMGFLFFGIGTALLFTSLKITSLVSVHSKYFMIGSILCFFLSCFAYPPLVLPVLILVLFCIFNLLSVSQMEKTWIISSAVIALACITFWVFSVIGLHRTIEIINYLRSDGHHLEWSSKLSKIASQFKKLSGLILPMLILMELMLNQKKKVRVAAAFILISFAVFYPHPSELLVLSHFSFLTLSLLIARLSFNKPLKNPAKLLALFVFFSGFYTSWVSANGLSNYFVGAAPTMLLLPGLWKEHQNSKGLVNTSSPLAILFIAAILINLRCDLFRFYVDGPNISDLTSTITEGPYKGLKTTDEKTDLNKNLISIFREIPNNLSSIGIFDAFSGGYLYSSRKPLAPTLFSVPLVIFPEINRQLLANYYNNSSHFPEIVLWFKKIPFNSRSVLKLTTEKKDILKERLLSHYVPYKENDYFDLWLLKETK